MRIAAIPIGARSSNRGMFVQPAESIARRVSSNRPFFFTDSLYYGDFFGFGITSDWSEERAFGGHDRFFSTSQAVTNEFRFDITSQLKEYKTMLDEGLIEKEEYQAMKKQILGL